MRRIRVLHLVSTGQVGGSERQAAMLLENLDKDLFDPHAILFRPGPLQERFRRVGPLVVLNKRAKVDLYFFVRLVQAVKHIAPDIVHTWDSTANLWGGLAARVAGIEHVVISEGELDLWKGWLWRRLDRILGRWADAVVCNADAICRASEARGVDPTKLRTIYNGVLLPPVESRDARDSSLIVIMGRIHPRKSHDVLIKSLPLVRDELPDARLAIVGAAVHPPEPAFKKELERLIEEMDLESHVEFWGHTEDPIGVLRRAAVAVVPSHSEGLPNVLLEAMAVGTPLVATAVGGTPEAIQNGVSGLLVPPDDPDALARAIAAVLNDADGAYQRAAAARKIARERFSLGKLTRSWADLYSEVVGRNAKTSTA